MYRFNFRGVKIECETADELRAIVGSVSNCNAKRAEQLRLLAKPVEREAEELESPDFSPTDAAMGSPEKLDILRSRFESGLPLWHDSDRYDYTGLTGAVRPRNERG